MKVTVVKCDKCNSDKGIIQFVEKTNIVFNDISLELEGDVCINCLMKLGSYKQINSDFLIRDNIINKPDGVFRRPSHLDSPFDNMRYKQTDLKTHGIEKCIPVTCSTYEE